MKKLPKFIIPLPPSINSAYFYSNRGKHVQMFYAKPSKDWFAIAGPIIQSYVSKHKFKGFDNYTYVDMHIYLRRSNADSHNYFKILFDGMEKFGMFTNDKFIMPRVQEIDVDTKDPRIEIEFASPYEPGYTQEHPITKDNR